MSIKKILKSIVVIAVVLASVFQTQPVFASGVSNVVNLRLNKQISAIESQQSLFTFTVGFELNGGVFTPDFVAQNVLFTRTATRPATDPVREGYVFTGWFTAAVGGSEFNFSTWILYNRTIHAQWEPLWEDELFVATFELNGGSFVSEDESEKVLFTYTIPRPETDPIQEGYFFTDWFTEAVGGSEFDFSTPIAADTVIYAQWEPTSIEFHEVIFRLNGGIVTADFVAQRVQSTETVARPTVIPVREGFVFTGWFTAAVGGTEFNFSTPITANTTIYAQWLPLSEVSHRVTFNFNGGTGASSGITISNSVYAMIMHGLLVQAPGTELGVEVTRSGHQLVGWTTVVNSRAHMFGFNTPIIQDITLFALWEQEIVIGTPGGNQRPPITIPPGGQVPPPIGGTPNPGTGMPPVGPWIPPTSEHPTGAPEDETDIPPLIAVGPPESSGVEMEVNEDGDIIITLPEIEDMEDVEITISNAPMGVEFARIGAFNEIFIIFPAETEPEEVDVTITPDEWTYEFFDDVEENLVLALLPPGIDLATVLRDPLNPQPRDSSLLNPPEVDDEEQEVEETYPEEDEQDEEDALDDDQYEEEEKEKETYREPSQFIIFSNSIVLIGAFLLKGGQLVFGSKKES